VKFPVDQQLPPALADWFRERGHESRHVNELGLGFASDAAIWRYALAEGFIIVTKDGDFPSRRAGTDGPQILWLRLGNAATTPLLAWMRATWPEVSAWLEAGEPVVEA
jgi:predicted nuclease of predicted toxin-antitoxin system